MSDRKAPRPSKLIPNSYQSPNYATDRIMRYLSGNEFKCLTVVYRKTFGWHKASDRISTGQLAQITGLGKKTVTRIMADLVRFRLVIRISESVENRGIEWAGQLDDRKVDLIGLRARQAGRQDKSQAQTAQARQNKGGMLNNPPDVEQPQGGDVEQPPQNPLVKPILTTATEIDPDFGKLVQKMEGITGAVNSATVQALETWLDLWVGHAAKLPNGHPDKVLDPYQVIDDLIQEAIDSADNRRPNNKYIRAILDRWIADGYKTDRRSKNGRTPRKANYQAGGQNGRGKDRTGRPATQVDRDLAERISQRAS